MLACIPHTRTATTRSEQDDGVNLEEWYQWLAAFTGLLCKKHR